MNSYEAFNWGKGVIERPQTESSTGWMMAGVGADYISLMQGVAEAGRKMNPSLAASLATPIISRGLLVMMGMDNATGIGGPENGHRFDQGDQGFRAASAALNDTKPPESWAGEASSTYADRNVEQQQRAEKMAETDETIKDVLDTEAGQLQQTRTVISRSQTLLTLQIPVAVALKAMPVKGPAMALAYEIAAVAATLPHAMNRFTRMAHDAARNATEIRRAGASYDSIAADAQQS